MNGTSKRILRRLVVAAFLLGYFALLGSVVSLTGRSLFPITNWVYGTAITLRLLLWPGLAASRLGLTHTWPIVLVALVAVGLLSLWAARRASGSSDSRLRLRGLVALLPVTLFLFAGWFYVFQARLPAEGRDLEVRYPRLAVEDKSCVNDSLYCRGRDYGYRRGMLNIWDNPGAGIEREVMLGAARGFWQGLREWESLIPGVTGRDSRADFVETFEKGKAEDPEKKVPAVSLEPDEIDVEVEDRNAQTN